MPGFGKSQEIGNPFEILDIAKVILDFLQLKKINKYALVGHSLGGYVAVAMAELSPSSINSLVLFHSTAMNDSKAKKDSREKAIKFINKNGGLAFLKSFIPPLFYSPSPEWVDRILNQAALIKSEILIAYTEAMKNRPDRQWVVDEHAIRTLIIAGKNDPILNTALLEKQAKSAINASFQEIEEVGHMGMLESSALSASLLLEFLRH